MKKPPYSFWNTDDGQAPPLEELIGLRVRKAALTSEGLFVLLEKDRCLMFKGVPAIGDFKAISLMVGDTIPGTNWEDLEMSLATADTPQPPHLAFLPNRTFDGMDKDVVLFGGGVGVQVCTEGVRFVKRATKEQYERTPREKRL